MIQSSNPNMLKSKYSLMYEYVTSIVLYNRILLIKLWQFYEFSQDKVIQKCLDYSFLMDISKVKSISIHFF